jgi:hypothetical protein
LQDLIQLIFETLTHLLGLLRCLLGRLLSLLLCFTSSPGAIFCFLCRCFSLGSLCCLLLGFCLGLLGGCL